MKFDPFYHNKPVLITGGCGFIGSHLAEALVKLQARVTILDDLSTGLLTNISSIKNRIQFIHDSITNHPACMHAAQNQAIIFHLAAIASVPQSMEQPAWCHEVNVQGTMNILEASRLNKVNRIVLASSSAVYGMHEGACSEETLCNPTSPYGFSKLLAEFACKQYTQIFNCSTATLRYFNVYGPRQRSQGTYTAAITHFRTCMEKDIPISIFGDGLQTRDFVAVNEIVQATLLIGMVADTNEMGNTFNIATGKSVSLLTVIEQLKAEFPEYQHPIQFYPARSGDIRHSQAVCTKYQKLRMSHAFIQQNDSLANEKFML